MKIKPKTNPKSEAGGPEVGVGEKIAVMLHGMTSMEEALGGKVEYIDNERIHLNQGDTIYVENDVAVWWRVR